MKRLNIERERNTSKETGMFRDKKRDKKGIVQDKFTVCKGIKGTLVKMHSFTVSKLAQD